MAIYGYVRVSTREQNEGCQVIALEKIGVTGKAIYMDKQSGKDFNRPQYKKLLRKLKRDDLLYIKSIDWLGRNYAEILKQWRILRRRHCGAGYAPAGYPVGQGPCGDLS